MSPETTPYVNVSVLVPVPDAYIAAVSVVPVSSVRVGVPITLTIFENTTCNEIFDPVP